MMKRTVCLAMVAFWPAMAQSSTDDAWSELRERTVAECTALAQDAAPGADVAVTPNEFGTETHALALVVTTLPDLAPELSVCLLDKQSGAAQLGVPFPEWPDALQPRPASE
ncbi:hypothetical protein [Paracoccus sp. Ld10]|uniref:hypothetical protein n=1 Tax=Paracoccus sp. Ld10 TaxID=649158 RepID=UPI0038697784